MTYKSYAGIGSRETPPDILALFEKIACFLAKRGFTLRSGAAEGADRSFELGCDTASGGKEIYLPWRGFNDSTSPLEWTKAGWDLASTIHPNWEGLKLGGRLMMARNSHQILGLELDSPCDFVCCWTPQVVPTGGTAQALRLAKKNGIKIFNFTDPKTLVRFRSFCRKV